MLAPLTALLVAQVSLYQTLRSAISRVAAVVAGVLLAVGLAALVGFTWWSLGTTIAVALAIGYALHLGDNTLEVPVSAMLILSGDTRAAATGRIVDTFIGTAAGLLAGFVFTSPQVQPAEDAIEDLCRKMSDLLARMAAGLIEGDVPVATGDWLAQARSLGLEIRRVDDALRQAEESLRLESSQPAAALQPGEPARQPGRHWSMRPPRSASSPGRSLTSPGWPGTTTR